MMVTRRPSALALTASLLCALSACNGGPTVPSASNGLELSVQVLRFGSHFDMEPWLSGVLTNSSLQEITVVFPSSCTVRLYVEDGRGENVYPGWEGCYQIVSPVTLAPRASTSRTFALKRGRTVAISSNEIVLPSGRYVAYAEIDGSIRDISGQRVTLRSRSILFEVP